jgi:hypothetical protein
VAIEQTYNWLGYSGKVYTYYVHEFPLKVTFKSEPGNYIFARQTFRGFIPIYMGHTKDLSERFSNHPKIMCIRNNGATHLHAHPNNGGEEVILGEESDLIDYKHPICNK